MNTCERTIVNKNWTGHRKYKCGRNAPLYCQEDGLPLCERHFNRWFKKTINVNRIILTKE